MWDVLLYHRAIKGHLWTSLPEFHASSSWITFLKLFSPWDFRRSSIVPVQPSEIQETTCSAEWRVTRIFLRAMSASLCSCGKPGPFCDPLSNRSVQHRLVDLDSSLECPRNRSNTRMSWNTQRYNLQHNKIRLNAVQELAGPLRLKSC